MDEEYVEAVLDLVAEIPPGRVMTYGLVAEVVRERLGRGGARQVGQIMSRAGSGVPWWRVVPATGVLPPHLRADGLRRLHAEGCPLSGARAEDDAHADDDAHPDDARVRVRAAVWFP